MHITYGKGFTEKKFALDILGISEDSYHGLKSGRQKVTGLRNLMQKSEENVEFEENIENIREKLIMDGYVGRTINYLELQKLHDTYGKGFTEKKFALDILRMSRAAYYGLKSGRQKRASLIYLGQRADENIETDEDIEKIKQELERQGYTEKRINYSEFQNLYRQYGSQMQEYEFARRVLEISANLLGYMRRLPKVRAKILKIMLIESFEKNIPEEEIEAIKEVLEEKGYGGKLIVYPELQLLHQTYGRQMREDIFSQVILEIPKQSYKKVKENGGKTTILCHSRKVELMHSLLFKESRWYSKEELKQICKQNRISLDKVIRNIVSNGTSLYNEDYKKALNKNGRLWIGKSRMSNEFIEKNFNLIMKKAKIALRSVKHRYRISERIEDEDMIQNAILYLMENAGNIEKNFIDNPEVLEKNIFNKLRRYITLRFLSMFGVKIRTTSLNRRFTPKKKSDKAKEGEELISRISNGYNLEEDVIAREKKDEDRRTRGCKADEKNS